MVLPPCHILFQFWSRELTKIERFQIYEQRQNRHFTKVNSSSKQNSFNIKDFNEKKLDEIFEICKNIPTRALSLQWYQRSVDTPLGLPFNIASYALLLEIVSEELSMVSEDLIFVGGDTHIYTNQLDGVDEQLSRDTLHRLPTLSFDISNNGQSILEQIRSKELDWHNFGFNDTYNSQSKIEFPLSN
jgi:thymidylate synthase